MSPTEQGHPLVEPDVLRELTEFRVPGEPDPVEDVVTIFLEVTPGRLNELAQAAAAGDRATVRSIAHTIKGSAGTVGANAMRQAAAEVEQSAADEALESVSRLGELFERTRPALMALVAELSPER